MTDNKLTDDHILKMLYGCHNRNSVTVMRIFSNEGIKKDIVITLNDVLDLINRLQAENNKLKYQVNRLKQYDEKRDIDLHSRLTAEARVKAIKEVLDEITEILHEAEMHGNYEPSLTIEIINDIKKKMRVDNG